jgi:hypothetical protein
MSRRRQLGGEAKWPTEDRRLRRMERWRKRDEVVRRSEDRLGKTFSESIYCLWVGKNRRGG